MKAPKPSTVKRRIRALYAIAQSDDRHPIECRIAQGMAVALDWALRGGESLPQTAADLARYCRTDMNRARP